MADIFLSYNREDLDTAQRYAEAFEREGFSVWWDQTLDPGEHYDHVTEKALKEARAVVVLWSRKSVESRWVRAEATLADRNKTLVPVMIEPCDRPIMFELTQTADLTHWHGDRNDKAWQAYLAGVRRLIEKGAPNPSPRPAPPRVASKPQRRVWMIVAAVVGAVLWSLYWANRPDANEDLVVAPTAAEEVSLAVLPFADLSTAKDQESFSDGLSEEILNQLAQIRGLRLIGRTSSFSFKGKNEDLRQIGEKLGVANLLEGSIRKEGDQLRITAQLINAKDGSHRWSQTYARELKDIFTVQEDIAKDVAQALSIKLEVGDMPRAQGGTTNVEAYEKFLRAESLADLNGSSDLEQSIQLYREAVAIDPGFARAWYGLYGALELLLVTPNPARSAEVRKEMSEISARVVSIAPEAWWTQTMLAEQYRQEHRWAEDEAAIRKAVAAAPPSQISVTTAYVLFLWATGRMQDAANYMQRAHQTNPLSRTDLTFLQLSLDLAGRLDEAQAAYEKARTLYSGINSGINWDSLALLRLWSRKDASPQEIKAQFRLFLQHENDAASVDSIMKHYETTESARAEIRRRYEESVKRNEPVPYGIARYADHYGDKDLALTALRRSLVDLRGLTLHEPWQPFETDLRADPRFKDLVGDLGLVDYFRASGNWGDFCRPVGTDDFECH